MFGAKHFLLSTLVFGMTNAWKSWSSEVWQSTCFYTKLSYSNHVWDEILVKQLPIWLSAYNAWLEELHHVISSRHLDNYFHFLIPGRGKKKKKLKKLLPILALIKLKLAALVPLFLGIIAFAVFKAYLLGKIAFIAAAFGAIKKLLESKKGGGGWSEPAHEEHGWESGGGGGWGRSQDAQSLAYAAHAKQA